MKEKNGFTLVELLAVVAILGLLIGIAVPSTLLISKKINSKLDESRIRNIEVAADHWLEDHMDKCLDFDKQTIETLVNENYLKADDSITSIQNKKLQDFSDKINLDDIKYTHIKNFRDLILCSNNIKTGTPNFAMGEPPESGTNNGSGIYKAMVDQGESYYFRGDKNALKNNVKFANQNWKIVRINEDGTIRLILNGSIEKMAFNPSNSNSKYTGFTFDNTYACTKSYPCEVTYDAGSNSFSNEKFGGKNSGIKTKLEEWYTYNLANYDSKIAMEQYCNDTSYGGKDGLNVYYGAYKRIKKTPDNPQPSLECPDPKNSEGQLRAYGGTYKTKIGLLTVDEINMVGLNIKHSTNPPDHNYVYYNFAWWSMSPYQEFGEGSYESVFYSSSTLYNGALSNDRIVSSLNVIPVINLASNILPASGDGSATNPYDVK